MNDCIFCKIIAKEIKAEIINENDKIIVFKDHRPSAPIHLLIVPKKHSVNPYDTNQDTLGLMLKNAALIAVKNGIDKKGYRLTINVGEGGGQVVPHIHLHLLSGDRNSPETGGGDSVVS